MSKHNRLTAWKAVYGGGECVSMVAHYHNIKQRSRSTDRLAPRHVARAGLPMMERSVSIICLSPMTSHCVVRCFLT